MNCGEFETLLADYIDGDLTAPARTGVEEHASACGGCRELMQDALGGLALLNRMPDVTPPVELINHIAFQVPRGRVRHPADRQSWFSRIALKWMQPILQPRLAMGMAMTLLSFAMLERCTGVQVQHIQAADLNPVRIWGGLEDRVVRTKDRAVKYYENLRWVYEIESRLRAVEDQGAAAERPAPAKNSRVGSGTGASRTNSSQGPGAGAPDQGGKRK